MDFSGYDKKIQNLASLVERQYTLFDEEIFHNLGLLLGIAESLEDEALQGYVYYQLADAYYSFHFDVEKMQKYLSLGIKVQQESEDFSSYPFLQSPRYYRVFARKLCPCNGLLYVCNGLL